MVTYVLQFCSHIFWYCIRDDVVFSPVSISVFIYGPGLGNIQENWILTCIAYSRESIRAKHADCAHLSLRALLTNSGKYNKLRVDIYIEWSRQNYGFHVHTHALWGYFIPRDFLRRDSRGYTTVPRSTRGCSSIRQRYRGSRLVGHCRYFRMGL